MSRPVDDGRARTGVSQRKDPGMSVRSVAGSGGSKWDLADFPSNHRFDAWSEVLGRTHIPFAVDLTDGTLETFSATVHEQRIGDMALVDAFALPHRGRRDQRQVSADGCDLVGLQYVVAGREVLGQGDRDILLGPGDLVMWDGRLRARYEVHETLHKRSLIMPRALARSVLPAFRGAFVADLTKEGAPGARRALVSLMQYLSDELPGMGSGARMASASLLVELLKALKPARERPVPRGSDQAILRDRIVAYIEEHLGDPTLSPASIAAAHAVSVRMLYTVTEGLDTTLAAYIRNRRLARCHEDLTSDPAAIGDIAFRWGITNQAHFSRLFRQRYGLSPRELRRL
jgi:AraC-like DNA-binding protein